MFFSDQSYVKFVQSAPVYSEIFGVISSSEGSTLRDQPFNRRNKFLCQFNCLNCKFISLCLKHTTFTFIYPCLAISYPSCSNGRVPPAEYDTFWHGDFYHYSHTNKSWDEAKGFCKSIGGHLQYYRNPKEFISMALIRGKYHNYQTELSNH